MIKFIILLESCLIYPCSGWRYSALYLWIKRQGGDFDGTKLMLERGATWFNGGVTRGIENQWRFRG